MKAAIILLALVAAVAASENDNQIHEVRMKREVMEEESTSEVGMEDADGGIYINVQQIVNNAGVGCCGSGCCGRCCERNGEPEPEGGEGTEYMETTTMDSYPETTTMDSYQETTTMETTTTMTEG